MNLESVIILVGLGLILILIFLYGKLHNACIDAEEPDPLVEAVERGEQQ